jgi:hypothetical protein
LVPYFWDKLKENIMAEETCSRGAYLSYGRQEAERASEDPKNKIHSPRIPLSSSDLIPHKTVPPVGT